MGIEAFWGGVAMDIAMACHAGEDALADRRLRRLRRLLASARQRSRFYRQRLRHLPDDETDLRLLPVVHKPELMQSFDEWVTDPALRLDALRAFMSDRSHIAQPFLGRYTVWESSGSSGEPGVFVQDELAMAVCDSLEALRRPSLRPLRRFLDPWGWSERIAFVGATDGHFASVVSIERLRRLNPMLASQLKSISFMQPIEAMVAQIDLFAPTVIATYPSAASLLAQEKSSGRLRSAPAEIWTGGEYLSPAERRFIRQAFGCPLADSYGASEFLSLAFECSREALHLNSDWAILESVDDEGRPVPAGEFGATALLTNLANHVQPLIRYDLGDRIAVHAERCACGSHLPVIEVQGRCDDTIFLEGADGRSVRVLPLALCTALEEGAGLFDFQVVQKGPQALDLRTGLRGGDTAEVLRGARHALAEFLGSQGAGNVRIHCSSGAPAGKGRSGKLPRVIASPGERARR